MNRQRSRIHLSRRGFTLLEMVVVLAIISILAGIAVVSFDGINQERAMREPVIAFEDLTMEAMTRANLHEKPLVIVFGKSGMLLSSRSSTGAVGRGNYQREISFPAGMTLFLRRFGQTVFQPSEGQRLFIAPGGICEPVSARFQRGSSWIEVTLDPLSGAIADEVMYLQ